MVHSQPRPAQQLASRIPEAEVRAGTAEDLPLEDQGVQTVVVAQAFHWFEHGQALDEIRRVLRPGALLVTLWNVRDTSAPWVAAYDTIQERYAGDTPRHRSMRWRTAIDDDARFEPVDDWHVPRAMIAA